VNTPIVLSTTGALPTGLTPGTTYFVRDVTTNTFNLAATAGGAAITTSGTQSGTHTATTQPVGSVRLFAAQVASNAETYDAANNVLKVNPTLWVNSVPVRVARLG
jgi:hypothetical protein